MIHIWYPLINNVIYNLDEESTTENQSNKKSSDPSQPSLASLPVKIEYAEEREKENSLGTTV